MNILAYYAVVIVLAVGLGKGGANVQVGATDVEQPIEVVGSTSEQGSGVPADETKNEEPWPEDQIESNKKFLEIFGKAKFGEDQLDALFTLVKNESGFQNDIKNRSGSSAYGMFQFLDSTWKNYGYEKTSDPITQIEAGLTYIEKRYGTPKKALHFWQYIAPTLDTNGDGVADGKNWY